MKLVEMKVNEFVDLMASDEPAPGGGPVSFSAEPGSSTLILYCAEGGGTLTFAGESSTIASGEAVLIQDPGSAPLHLDCPGPASFMAAQVRSLP